MRIIGGQLGGIRITPPANLPVRPTTDLAKEALFNILQHHLSWEEASTLDLFSGTGNIALELASRQAKHITAVDQYGKCCAFIHTQKIKYKLEQLEIVKSDVFKFIQRCKQTFDFIFADPPYDLPMLTQLPQLIFNQGLLHLGGIFVLEHPNTRKIEEHPFFIEKRNYGYSAFSIFQRR